MDDFFVKVKKEKVKIDKEVFLSLFDLVPIKKYVAYKNALASNEITLADLKNLAQKADIPYPLFFAPKNTIDLQIKDKDKNLFEKLPGKDELRLGARGSIKVGDIEIIAKDLGRKQELFKKRVLPNEDDNEFIGCIAKKAKESVSTEILAKEIREFLEIDLNHMRRISKDDVLSYLSGKAENKNIFVSFSSHNYMPQKIDKDSGLSGICIKDKKFPYIFINTRDGDKKPKILETSGRQIFTVVSMLVCIAMNKFFISIKTGRLKDASLRQVFLITSEILIPKQDLVGIQIGTLEELKEEAKSFRVTPSMLLSRLRELQLIKKPLADMFRQQLSKELAAMKPKSLRQPLPINGYKKYNGERFSREIIRAYDARKISLIEAKNILFRKGRMGGNLFQEYKKKFG